MASGHALGQVPPGYGGRHVRKGWAGTGEARLVSLVSKDRRYKPVVKLSGAQRESDGAVVPGRAAGARGPGKGPGFGHAGNGATREGMAGAAQPNYPDGHTPAAKVRQLQNRLWAAAKQSKGRRFHALYDRAYRADILWEAWQLGHVRLRIPDLLEAGLFRSRFPPRLLTGMTLRWFWVIRLHGEREGPQTSITGTVRSVLASSTPPLRSFQAARHGSILSSEVWSLQETQGGSSPSRWSVSCSRQRANCSAPSTLIGSPYTSDPSVTTPPDHTRCTVAPETLTGLLGRTESHVSGKAGEAQPQPPALCQAPGQPGAQGPKVDKAATRE